MATFHNSIDSESIKEQRAARALLKLADPLPFDATK